MGLLVQHSVLHIKILHVNVHDELQASLVVVGLVRKVYSQVYLQSTQIDAIHTCSTCVMCISPDAASTEQSTFGLLIMTSKGRPAASDTRFMWVCGEEQQSSRRIFGQLMLSLMRRSNAQALFRQLIRTVTALQIMVMCT